MAEVHGFVRVQAKVIKAVMIVTQGTVAAHACRHEAAEQRLACQAV